MNYGLVITVRGSDQKWVDDRSSTHPIHPEQQPSQGSIRNCAIWNTILLGGPVSVNSSTLFTTPLWRCESHSRSLEWWRGVWCKAMPSRLLEGIGNANQYRLAKRISRQLQTDRQPVMHIAHRYGNRRETRVRCNMLAVVTMRRVEVAD